MLSSKADEEAIAVAEHLKKEAGKPICFIDYAQKAFARQSGIPCLKSVENLFPTKDVKVGENTIYNGFATGSLWGKYFFLFVLIFGIILILAGSSLYGLVFSGIALVCLLNKKWKELRRYNSRFEPRPVLKTEVRQKKTHRKEDDEDFLEPLDLEYEGFDFDLSK